MPDVLVFGASGYVGRLAARALAERGVSFALAGRNESRLRQLARECGGPEVRRADASSPDSLVEALDGCRVLLTTVGPFASLGWAAVEAAVTAGVHYLDSCGEGPFVASLFERYRDPARAAGIAVAPALAFDEIPAEVAASLATESLGRSDLVLTYAVPSAASPGTARSLPFALGEQGPFVDAGHTVPVRLAERRRWAPLPPPLGPKPALSAPLAELHLARRHLDLSSVGTYVTLPGPERLALRWGMPWLRAALRWGPAARALGEAAARLTRAPQAEGRRSWWMVLAEARAGARWRNVAVMGRDVYGLSGELLAASAARMASADFDASGVLTPVQALGLDFLHKQLIDLDVSIEIFEPT